MAVFTEPITEPKPNGKDVIKKPELTDTYAQELAREGRKPDFRTKYNDGENGESSKIHMIYVPEVKMESGDYIGEMPGKKDVMVILSGNDSAKIPKGKVDAYEVEYETGKRFIDTVKKEEGRLLDKTNREKFGPFLD